MTDEHDRQPDDVDPAEALGGPGALPLPEGQPRGFVPTDRDAPGTEEAPEAAEVGDEGEATQDIGDR